MLTRDGILTMDEIAALFDRYTEAQGIAARSDTTGTGVAEGKSAVAKPCAQTQSPNNGGDQE